MAMESETLVASKQSFQLDLPPSCLQFCQKHPEYFVVGTYNLQQGDSQADAAADQEETGGSSSSKRTYSRNGSLLVFRLETGVDEKLWVYIKLLATFYC